MLGKVLLLTVAISLIFVFSAQTVFAYSVDDLINFLRNLLFPQSQPAVTGGYPLCYPDYSPCEFNSDCCSGQCDWLKGCIPSSGCASDGSFCSYDLDCCSGICDIIKYVCLPTQSTTTTTTSSTTTSTTQPQCNEGNYRCVGQNLERCTNGVWQFVQSCTYDCLVDHCASLPTTTSTTSTSTTATSSTTTSIPTTTIETITSTTAYHYTTTTYKSTTTTHTTTTIFSTTSSTINLLSTTSIPPDCFKSDDCDSCASIASCGWCKNKNQCKIGNENGSNDNSCLGNNWVFYSDQCGTVKTSSQQPKILLIVIMLIEFLIKNPLIAILLLILLIIFLSNKRFIYKKLKLL